MADRECIADGSWSGCVYHADSGRTEAKLRKTKLGYRAFVFSPKGSLMAEQTGEGLRVVGTDDWMLRYARKDITHVFGNCRGGFAGTSSRGPGEPDCQLLIMDWTTGRTLAKHRLPGLVAVSPSLQWYVKGDDQTGLEIRSLTENGTLQRLAPPGKSGPYLRGFSDDGRWLGMGQDDEVLILRTTDQ